MKWKIAKKISPDFKSQFPEINPIILQLLYNRGLRTQEEIDAFLLPDYSQDLYDPFLFVDMERAVKRIFLAIKKKERILIYGDYDADGISAAVILFEFFRKLGVKVDVYLPDREREGYGLNKEAIKNFVQQKIDLIITVDCGISNSSEVDLASKSGIEIIITDHHNEPNQLPKRAYALINPKLSREHYPFKFLAGVGVSYKLIQALIAKQKEFLGEEVIKSGWEKWLLDLVAVGTVADLMPLLGENRTLVKYGLIVLNKTPRIGLNALIEKAGLSKNNLSTDNIAFQIAPRLNAAGRMDHANVSFKLLTTESLEEAEKIALELNQINQQRQKLIEKIVNEINQKLEKEDFQKKSILIWGKDWPVGIIGLIAGRLTDKWYRPSIVLTEKERTMVASGRSIKELDIMEVLKELDDYFLNYGGHSRACGFTLKDKKLLESFQKDLEELIEEKLKGVDFEGELFIESQVSLREITWQFYEDLEKFEPFGQDNNRPRFLVENVEVIGLERVGSNGHHLRIFVRDDEFITKKMIGFNLSENWAEKLKIGDRIDVVFELSVNQWNGSQELQLKIIDLKINQ